MNLYSSFDFSFSVCWNCIIEGNKNKSLVHIFKLSFTTMSNDFLSKKTWSRIVGYLAKNFP